MNNEYYGVSTTSSQDFLAHYGVKGMKWGVRKAIASGSDRALRRQYKKASKKLAKLEKLGANGKKYAKRAAAYGAGAAAAGGLAALGTQGVARVVDKVGHGGGDAAIGVGAGINALGRGVDVVGRRMGGNVGNALRKTGLGISKGGKKVVNWGKSNSAIQGVNNTVHAIRSWGNSNTIGNALGKGVVGGADKAYKLGARGVGKAAQDAKGALSKVSNNTYARIGAGVVGAGLGIAAGRNAYRAATAKKHAAQAQEFRREMNKAFAGTKYANGMPNKSNKRRK